MADLEELIVVDVQDPVYIEVPEITVISQGEQGPPGVSPVTVIGTGYIKWSGVVFTALATIPWSDITGTPTLLSGYGITDVYTKAEVDALVAGSGGALDPDLIAIAALSTTGYAKRTGTNTWALTTTIPWADLSGVPATFPSSAHTHPWSDITGTPTTLAGYGITDAYTKTASDAKYALIATTLAGYGITDAYTKTASDAKYALIATTLAGYGITDAYTKTAADARYQPIDSDLTALAALAATGIAVQTAVGTWAQRTITAGANVGVTNGDGVSGNPTIAVTSLNNAPIGATTPSTGAFTTFSATGAGTLPGSGGWLSTGEHGVLTAGSTDTGVLVGLPSSTATTLSGVRVNFTSPATATVAAQGFGSTIASAASAYTVTDITHFVATLTTKGAASTITNVRGFYAKNAIAIATNNYGFYSDIASATTTWAFYGSGTAQSFFGGPVGIVGTSTDALGGGHLILVGNGSAHPNTTQAFVAGMTLDYTGGTTATSGARGFVTTIRSAASAYTVADITHFFANTTSLGATSAITVVKGFYARNNIAAAATNYGFYSDVNSSTANYQFYAAGTAPSFFNSSGGIAIGAGPFNPVTSNLLIGFANAHTGTGTSIAAIGGSLRGTSTGTALFAYVQAMMLSATAAYTLADMIGFHVNTFTLGAGSTITNAKAFAASSVFAIATNNFGFWTDLGTGANNYAFYGSGTAKSLFGGAIIEKEVTITYSASMTPDASLGNEQIITATNATAFTINAPTNPATGQYLEITLRNTSGGALGVATWNAVYKMTAWTSPATAFSRTIVFRYNGTNWVEKGRTAADIPN
jgi:hypothetical protein